ncbi:MAG TPA: hypothetical protein VIF88_14230 [Methylocystis sp.]|jgi:hypothetical protein
MNLRPVSLPPNREAVEHFEDAARQLRELFRSSVAEALPGFARQLFEREWQEAADLTSIESVPPLALAYLMSCERCVQDLLNKNYEGVASAHFEKCVREAANEIRTKVVVSGSYEGDTPSQARNCFPRLLRPASGTSHLAN